MTGRSLLRHPHAGIVGLLVLAAALFVPGLDRAPLHLNNDEVLFGLHAHALSETGRDANGRLLPLYIQAYPGSNYWLQPIAAYVTALLLTVAPLSDVTVRLPTVLVGLLTILLLYAVALRLFERRGHALLAAAILAFTPAHLIHSRLASDYEYPLPFVLGWLLCLLLYLERRQPVLLFAGGTCLGLGFFSYIASVVMMPIYLLVTLVVLLVQRSGWRAFAYAVAGFAWPLLLVPIYLIAQPTVIADFQARYRLGGVSSASGLNPLGQFFDIVNPRTVAERLNLYHDFFSPGFLFISGGSNIANSTRQAGVYLLPMAVFLLAGLVDVVTRLTRAKALILTGFLTAPLAALIVVENYAIDRALALLPFGALLATLGILRLWSARARAPVARVCTPIAAVLASAGVAYSALKLLQRGELSGPAFGLVAAAALLWLAGRMVDASKRLWPAVVALLIAGAAQYVGFYRDYHSDYPARSAAWFGNNMRGAVEQLIALDAAAAAPAVYLSESIRQADAYWQFYVTLHGRRDLVSKGRAVDLARFDPAAAAPGSLVLAVEAEAAAVGSRLDGGYEAVSAVTDPNDAQSPLGPGEHVTFVIFRKLDRR
jgi:4-amino-4-deoxy-L-arabinose transferase-like glycosyltransferase